MLRGMISHISILTRISQRKKGLPSETLLFVWGAGSSERHPPLFRPDTPLSESDIQACEREEQGGSKYQRYSNEQSGVSLILQRRNADQEQDSRSKNGVDTDSGQAPDTSPCQTILYSLNLEHKQRDNRQGQHGIREFHYFQGFKDFENLKRNDEQEETNTGENKTKLFHGYVVFCS